MKTGTTRTRRGYVMIWMPEHPQASNGYVCEHRLVAERVLGRPVPEQHPVHHVNRVKSDNRPENLVLCEDAAYHQILHRRQRALDATGDANSLKCRICLAWDGKANLRTLYPNGGYRHRGLGRFEHPECRRKAERKRAAAWRERAEASLRAKGYFDK